MNDLLLNLAFCSLLLVSSWGLFRRRRIATPLSAIRLALTLAPTLLTWALVPLLAEDLFGLLRLSSWVFFLHVPLLLVVTVSLRRQSDRSAVVGIAAAAALVAVGFWAFFVEPTRLEVSSVSIATADIEREIEIAVLSDFQTDRIGPYERRVLASLSALDADLILLTGDYLQVDAKERPALRTAFQSAWREAGIDAPLGVFAVQGNTEPASWPKLFADLDVTVLDDSLAQNTALRKAGIELHGLSLDQSFRVSSRQLPGTDSSSPTSPVGLGESGRKPFRVVFGHGPDFALGLEGADLMVAGHTHGGQVQIPFFGPPITFSRVPRSWAAGKTTMPDGSTLLVSRGTGLERGHAPRMRLWCRPEIVVITLQPPRN